MAFVVATRLSVYHRCPLRLHPLVFIIKQHNENVFIHDGGDRGRGALSFVLISNSPLIPYFTPKVAYLRDIKPKINAEIAFYKTWLDNNDQQVGELRVVVSIGGQGVTEDDE